MTDEPTNAKSDLLSALYEINDLESAAHLLVWDQATYMPPGGAPARARQCATLRTLAHQKLVSSEFGRLLGEFEKSVNGMSHDSDDASLARVTRRMYDEAADVPPEFLYEFTEHTTACFSAWAVARPADDFGAVKDYLTKTLDLSRRYADFFPNSDHVADPLIEKSDYSMSVSTIQPIFADLRQFLSALAREIEEQQPSDPSFVGRVFEEDAQRSASVDIIQGFGYDFSRGRLDKTHHPFMTKFSLGDARITTRFSEDSLAGMFGTMHESGHAMYEQGIDLSYERTPLANGTSSAVHESQSRMWENVVGRSEGFWSGYYPKLQQYFPYALGDVSLDTFYRSINHVSPSLIRVDADEVTYGLHIIIRFELELALLEGVLSIDELPEAWNAKYDEYLGITPTDDRDGVMQDVHWYTDFIGGMFQGYALGNVLAAQFYAAALAANPTIPDQIASGQFDILRNWLTDNIYRHGSKYTTLELVERVTGGPITTEPYKRYLRDKYGQIYGLSA
ncbi:MAG: carboxypeptidase M32 [Caldilineaceae bacterium]